MGALLGIVAGEVACQLKGGESALFPNKDAHSNQARGGHPPNTAEPNNTPDQNDSIQEEPDDEVVLEDQLIPGPKVHFNVQSEDEVELMLEVERRYKEVLHSKTGRYGGCWYRPSEILPFAKETIEAALVTLVCIAEGLYADAVLGFVEDSEVTAHRRRLVRSLGRFVDCPAAILPSDPEKNREFVRDLGIVAPKPEDPEATTYPLW